MKDEVKPPATSFIHPSAFILQKMPIFHCQLESAAEPFPHFWKRVVGSGHAPLALRADWQAQLKRCHDELGFESVRFHGLLSHPMDTLICQNNQLLYSFFNIDQIFDFLPSIGMRPFVELSFMPQTLASGSESVFHYQSNVTPPKDLKAWGELMRRLAVHWVERYGAEEVRQWHFEVWNEPNLKNFWTGSQQEYFELYRHTVEAIKSVDSELQVGGPATAANAWIPDFLDFCEQNHLPADFVSTHHYPTDAFGEPDDDTETQLSKSRRSVLREQVQNARGQARGKPLFYTEWNTSSNPRDELHDQPYAAAFITKTIMEARGSVDGYGFWTFSDIFQENYMPSEPFQGGFGLLNIQGIAKPAYRAYQLLHRQGDEILVVDGVHETVDAWVTRRGETITALLSNSALPRHPIETEQLTLQLAGAKNPDAVFIERIDEEHANARRLWETMGRPTYPDAAQRERLHAASVVTIEPLIWKYENATVEIEFPLPPQAVALVTLQFAAAERADRTSGEACT
jgi:xylan 1,4-beta-xylosidase